MDKKFFPTIITLFLIMVIAGGIGYLLGTKGYLNSSKKIENQ
jgi:hypothetical protein